METTRCLTRRWGGAVTAFLCILVTMASCWANGPAGAQTPDAFSQNKRLGGGVNILGYDPIWKDRQKARFQEKFLRLIKEAGFDHVRINLHPFRDGKLAADHKINAAWFDVLDWAVKHALANRLMAILDLHEFQAMGDDPLGNKERFLAVWRQIAEHYKDAPNDVLFEILNEPNKKLTPELWNPMLREALGIIRQSNPRRTVIVGPTSWNGINDLDKLDLSEEDRNLIVTVHYYSPFPFTHQGAAFAGRKDKTGVPWNGTEQEQQAIVKDFDKAQAWAQKRHRPIYLGEFGVYDKAAMGARMRWAGFVRGQAEDRTWSWAWWQFDGDFVLYDVRQDHWVVPIKQALAPSTAEERKQILKALRSRTQLEFVDTPLSYVVAYLKEYHHIEMKIDRDALDSANLEQDPPVKYNLKGISLQSALRLMLRQLDLTYVIRGKVLLITTPQQAAEMGDGPVTVSIDAANEKRIAEALKSPTQLEFKETPLADVVDYLKDYCQIEIQLDRKALGQAGIGVDIPVTMDVKEVPLQLALRRLLRHRGMGYAIRDEVLFITTAREAAAMNPNHAAFPDIAIAAYKKRIADALASKIEIEFTRMPLEAVIQSLADRHKIDIWIDLEALKRAGIDRYAYITKNLKGVSLRSALTAMLDDLGLRFDIADEGLLIVPKKRHKD